MKPVDFYQKGNACLRDMQGYGSEIQTEADLEVLVCLKKKSGRTGRVGLRFKNDDAGVAGGKGGKKNWIVGLLDCWIAVIQL